MNGDARRQCDRPGGLRCDPHTSMKPRPRTPDNAGSYRVLAVVEARQAGLRDRCRHRVESGEPAGIGNELARDPCRPTCDADPLVEGPFRPAIFPRRSRHLRWGGRHSTAGPARRREAVHSGVARRDARGNAKGSSASPTGHLRLGGRHSTAGPARRREAVHSGVDRRDARGNAKSSSASTDGARESAQDWRDLLLDLRGGVL